MIIFGLSNKGEKQLETLSLCLSLFIDRCLQFVYFAEEKGAKPKKIKARQFDIPTLCFYEKPVQKENSDPAKPFCYNGMAREVWAPIDDVSFAPHSDYVCCHFPSLIFSTTVCCV